MPLPNPVRCTKKPRAKASSSSKSKPRLPPNLQIRVLLAFFDNLHDQGGVNIDISLHQLPSLSLVCEDWATLVRPEYAKWSPFDLRLKIVKDGVETHVFDSELVEERLEMLRRARCTCCYSRGGLRVAFDNPDGKSFSLRSKVWKRTADNVIAEFKHVPQLQLELGDIESSSYADLIWRFTRRCFISLPELHSSD